MSREVYSNLNLIKVKHFVEKIAGIQFRLKTVVPDISDQGQKKMKIDNNETYSSKERSNSSARSSRAETGVAESPPSDGVGICWER